jgi:hypothetical protein
MTEIITMDISMDELQEISKKFTQIKNSNPNEDVKLQLIAPYPDKKNSHETLRLFIYPEVGIGKQYIEKIAPYTVNPDKDIPNK